MITYTKGNILDSRAQTLTCPVNCVGVMGKGLALEFKKWFPGLIEPYKKACVSGELAIGRSWVFRVNDAKQVLCFPTKDHWKRPSIYDYVRFGLVHLKKSYVGMGIQSLALPALGCGLGGLEWSNVKLMIQESMGELPISIEVFEP